MRSTITQCYKEKDMYNNWIRLIILINKEMFLIIDKPKIDGSNY